MATASQTLSFNALENKVSELSTKTTPCFSYSPKYRPVGLYQGNDHPRPKNYNNGRDIEPEKQKKTNRDNRSPVVEN
jgi:hypothetical protein